MAYNTEQKKAILNLLSANPERQFTAEEIAEALSGAVGVSTVYRRMPDLVKGGDSGKVKIGLMTDSNAVSIADMAVKGLESELPRVIGTQTHAYADAVRIVGGIDMLYYSEMGYIVERGESSIEKLSRCSTPNQIASSGYMT